MGQSGETAPQKCCDIPIVSVPLHQAVNTIFSQSFLVKSYKTLKIFCSNRLSWAMTKKNQKKPRKCLLALCTALVGCGIWVVRTVGTLQGQCRLTVLHLLPSSCYSHLPPPSTRVCVALQCHRSHRGPTSRRIYKATKVELRKISMLTQ